MSTPPIPKPGDNEYFEHDADIGVVGRGVTLEEAFESAASATFAVMADLSAVRPERSVTLDFEEADIEIALVRWLNLLLGLSHEQGLVFSRFWIERDASRQQHGTGPDFGREPHENAANDDQHRAQRASQPIVFDQDGVHTGQSRPQYTPVRARPV